MAGMLISRIARSFSSSLPSFTPRLLHQLTNFGRSALFTPPLTSLSFGSRHSPFLQIDRLSSLQQISDTHAYTANFLNRLGQLSLIHPRSTFSDAIHFFKLSASSGNSDAQCALGILHHAGVGVERNSLLGTDYLRRAAIAGHPRAKYCYGLCLRSGLGVRLDLGQAMAQLRTAAEDGYDEAMFAYGCSLLGGIGVERDEKTAFSLFQKGAQQGHTPSILWQGVCLHDGLGVEKDRARAVSLFREASSRGLPEATEALMTVTSWEGQDFQARPIRADDNGK
jgi:TPR repeat protein